MAKEAWVHMDTFQLALESFMQDQQHSQNHGSSSNSHPNQSPRQSLQVRKLNFYLPQFDGNNALEWIFSANQFFDYYNISDMERIVVAAMHMDKGVALGSKWCSEVKHSTYGMTWIEPLNWNLVLPCLIVLDHHYLNWFKLVQLMNTTWNLLP